MSRARQQRRIARRHPVLVGANLAVEMGYVDYVQAHPPAGWDFPLILIHGVAVGRAPTSPAMVEDVNVIAGHVIVDVRECYDGRTIERETADLGPVPSSVLARSHAAWSDYMRTRGRVSRRIRSVRDPLVGAYGTQ